MDNMKFHQVSWTFVDTPKITHQPYRQRKMVGDKAMLEVLVTWKCDVKFQWYKDGKKLVGKKWANQTHPLKTTLERHNIFGKTFHGFTL